MKSEVKIVIKREFDFNKVRYYTVKFDNDDKTEVDKFFEKYQESHSKSVLYIKMWIAEIGEKFSAEARYFRPEDNSEALPPPFNQLESVDIEIDQDNLSLRLYCIVLSPEVVVLVNGGIKESQKTQDSPTCWEHFLLTSSLSSQMRQMIKGGHLTLKGKQLKRTKEFILTYDR